MGDAPAAAHPADDVGRRDPGVGHEHLVERCVPVHLTQRADVDAGLVHGEGEVGDPPVLGRVPVGAGEEHPVAGVMGAGRPHLLAVDHPLVAVPLGVRREPGEIRAAAWLAEQLAPGVGASDDGTQEPILQVVRTVLEDGRGGQPHARALGRADGSHPVELAVHHVRHRRREAPSPPLGRPRRSAPTGVGQQIAPASQGQVRVPVLRQPGANLGRHRIGRCHRRHRMRAQGSSRAVAVPEKTSAPSWFTVRTLSSATCSPPCSRTAATVALATSVSPGHT